jgi:hypothetical protein
MPKWPAGRFVARAVRNGEPKDGLELAKELERHMRRSSRNMLIRKRNQVDAPREQKGEKHAASK